jgi:magnesium-protoporphyrin O-methyltransferase
MTCAQCCGIERFFDDRVARRELRRYRRKGASKTTAMLVRALARQGADGARGASFLDVGGGVGAVQHELMAAGASGGTSVDASPAYLETARSEATARGYAERVRYLGGDVVELQPQLDPADLVSLDRVVCCYPDMPALVDATAKLARGAYGLVYPRDTRLTRVAIAALNLVQRVRRDPFRAFVHRTEDVEARVESHGLRKAEHETTMIWQVVVFTRASENPVGTA